MASCLQLPMASSYSLTSSTASLTSSKNRVSSIKSRSVINCIRNGMPLFLKKLPSVASTSPQKFLHRPQGSDTLPFLDIYESPKLMATPAQFGKSIFYKGPKRRHPPPDLPSSILDSRVIFIGLPLVPMVTELVIQQLLYLQWENRKEPIYMHINSTGTINDDDEMVALESEGFAIYDVMMQMKNEIHTLGLGSAVGHACLLLSAGTKGKRYMLPSATALLQPPQVPSSGLMAASDIAIRAKEAIINRDTLISLLAKHTGNSEEVITHVMRGPFHMNSTKAKAFGVIDEILWQGYEKFMSDAPPPEDWYKAAGIKAVDAI